MTTMATFLFGSLVMAWFALHIIAYMMAAIPGEEKVEMLDWQT